MILFDEIHDVYRNVHRKSNHVVKGDIERYPSRTGMYIVQHHRLHHVADLGTFQSRERLIDTTSQHTLI